MKHVKQWLLCAAIIGCMSIDISADEIHYHIADRAEGQQLIKSCTDYYENINDKTLAFFLQKKDGTIEEYIEYSADQVTEFSDDMKSYIEDFYNSLDERLAERGLQLPGSEEIKVVGTTGAETSGATGYTHDTTIYLNVPQLDKLLKSGSQVIVDHLLVHELFHCLTRNNQSFRADMYGLIGFVLNDEEFDIPKELRELMIANPDVEHHDAYAAFTINGEKKDCYLLFMADGNFEQPGDSFFSTMYTGIVTVDENELYRVEDTEDFWEVVGTNTGYVEDPEECMAENFTYAVLYGTDGSNGQGYNSPEIIDGILAILRS